MRREHCEALDSAVPFLLPNKKAESTSEIEWRFVDSPEHGPDGRGTRDDFVPYPKPSQSRQARSFEEFEAARQERNAQLMALGGAAAIVREEFVGARL